MSMYCVYEEPWIGRCNRVAKFGTLPPVCEDHADRWCWCGKQAVKGCSVASSLVCGQPLCSEHDCHRRGYGMTGTTWHSEKGHEQYEHWCRWERPFESKQDPPLPWDDQIRWLGLEPRPEKKTWRS